jgi:hypothetical protein
MPPIDDRGGVQAPPAVRPRAVDRAPSPKDRRFGGGEEMMTWRGGTHELGREIGKLLEQIVF